jgi:DNA polymerase III subunit delta
MPEEMKPAYLLSGTDAAKIDAARGRLRARAEAEGGPAALQVFEASEGRGAPDHEALLAAIPALSLTEARRYLLVDGVDRWRDAQHREVAGALAGLPPDLTLVLIARGKVPAELGKAVTAAGGEVLTYEAPKGRALPSHLAAEAKRLGFRLEPAAARMLVARMGQSSLRLTQELERLALWAGPGGEVTAADLEAMIADTSEAAVWSLSDALLDRDPEAAVRIADRLLAQGENVTGLVYALASRLRRASQALASLEDGTPRKVVEKSLGMHPYAARQLLSRLGDVSPDDLRAATAALADLEVWCRGGADYGDSLAFTLALRRAAGAEATAA